ncbi:MAG TPA: hypothetical protein VGY97_01525 [Solirubrobacteraceae bacterium]|nr:hypothetical protein [Solirubrobacteraceae bacterium]
MTRRQRARAAIPAVTTLALFTAISAGAHRPAVAADARAEGLDTTLVTRSRTGGLPDGPSSQPAISRDQRYARVLAFSSAASDLVAASTGAVSNVYYIERQPPYDNLGVPWVPGPIQLVSAGPGGAPANGPSADPVVSGDNRHAPSCIAFISAATNLVAGDTNGHPDAFVFHLRSRTIERVSVGRGGREADGSAHDVTVNGDCSEVAFTDDASNLVAGAPAGVKQVYVRDLRHHRTTIASGGRHGAGDADSSQPAFGRRNTLAFSSAATNLAGPTGGHVQVFLRSRPRAVSMLSRTPSGVPGDGDSDQPALSQAGDGVAFRTRAANLAPGADRFSQIVHSRRGTSLRTAGPASSGDAAHPEVVNNGHYTLYDSADPRLGSPFGQAGAAYLYTDVRNLVLPISVDSNGQRLRLPGSDPASSEVSNYIFFETSDPAADTHFAQAHGTALVPPQLAAANPAFHQIYLRYLGGK